MHHALLLLALLFGCAGPPSRPNLVLVTLDTTRADHLGVYGYHRDTTATLDALSKDAIVFENLLVPMATTLPSHTTLFTATEPLEHGVLANLRHGGFTFKSSPSLQSFTQILDAEGYQTAAYVSASPLNPGSGIESGFDIYLHPKQGSRTAGRTVRSAVAFLEVATEPFFVWVHFFDAHGPFDPPKRHAKQYLRDGKVHGWLEERQIGATSERPTGQVLDSVDAVNLYDGEIRYADRQLGRVFEALEERGLTDRTVIVVAGDHGEGLGQHGMAGHGGVWREQLHAPLMIKSPWSEAARIETPIGMADVLPTLLGLVEFPGASKLLEQASGRNALAHGSRPLYHSSSARQLEFGRVQDALSVGSLRFLRLEDGAERLFDLRHDPHELADLTAALPIHARLMNRWLMAEHEQLRARGEALGRAEGVRMSEEEIEQLRLLGYVDDEPGAEAAEAAEAVQPVDAEGAE